MTVFISTAISLPLSLTPSAGARTSVQIATVRVSHPATTTLVDSQLMTVQCIRLHISIMRSHIVNPLIAKAHDDTRPPYPRCPTDTP